MNISTVKEIYSRNYGSEKFYKRSYCESLIYTEGIMDFQETLNATWLVDNIIYHLPKIIEIFKAVDDGFFVVKIKVKDDNSGYFEIFREGYVNNEYNDHITVVKQKLPYIDLPTYDYKFYLILSNLEPIIFTFLLTSEY